jgi:hypothetical protein
VADLEPGTVLLGHRSPLYDGERVVEFVADLDR